VRTIPTVFPIAFIFQPPNFNGRTEDHPAAFSDLPRLA
jgi:hypothetical protein